MAITRKEKVDLSRSYFKGRQEVYGHQWVTTKKDGTPFKGYAPVCQKFWSEGCNIKLGNGKGCAPCTIKQYEPVSDETVWKHISGEDQQIVYLVLDDGTVYFSALDYDKKPERPHHAYHWEDVKLSSDILKGMNVPHGIARSSGEGFHLYVFYSEPVAASKARALHNYILERAGFVEQLRQGIRPLPEVFPKQNYTGGFGPGNGICTAMIETKWPEERKGFVDFENNFISPENQWAYLASIPKMSSAELDAVLAANEIEVVDEALMAPGGTARTAIGRSYSARTGKWQQPLTGSIEKVVEGCAAFRRTMEKNNAGTVLGHDEGFGLFHVAMHTLDGLDYFKKNVKGWGQSESDMRQLEHSLTKDYAPWTCKKMQEKGVCYPGTKCFERKPPVVLREGQYVQLTDVPESEWPEPGPIRFAFGKGDDFLERLKAEADTLKDEKDEVLKGTRLREIALRAQAFDEDQQRALREHIKSLKVMRAPELNKIFNKAEDQKEKEFKEKAETHSNIVVVGNTTYQLVEPYGYSMMKRTKNGVVTEVLCTATIEIIEERTYLDGSDLVKSAYHGVVKWKAGQAEFDLATNKWGDTQEFLNYFLSITSTGFNPHKADVDAIRVAALAFANKNGFKKTNVLITQGWSDGAFLMPSIQVDKDKITINENKSLDLADKGNAAFLDFKSFDDDSALKEVLLHIKTDLMNAWPRKWTTISIAHAMLPALVKPLKLKAKASLFLEGLTGSGKTELLTMMQWFWGEFESLTNLTSTGKGLMAVVHDFKDCLVVFDDFKSLDYAQTSALQHVIQYSYDGTQRITLNKDSSIRKPKQARGVIAFTGEHFLTNDSAMVARTIMIEVSKQDTKKTRDAFRRCLVERKFYSGVTPHFIHFCLQQNMTALAADIVTLSNVMKDHESGRQNVDRISNNMATNHIVYMLWVDFLVEKGVCSLTEREELLKEHLSYCYEVQSSMLSRCEEEQNGEVFIRYFLQLVASGDLVIIGVNNDMEHTRNKPVVGQKTKADDGREIINVLTDMLFRSVKAASTHNPIRGTEREFGKQLLEKKILITDGDNRIRRQVRVGNNRAQGWVLDAAMLGITTIADKVVIQGGKAAPIQKETEEILNADPFGGKY